MSLRHGLAKAKWAEAMASVPVGGTFTYEGLHYRKESEVKAVSVYGQYSQPETLWNMQNQLVIAQGPTRSRTVIHRGRSCSLDSTHPNYMITQWRCRATTYYG